jgi:hypothetical protein
MLPKGYILNLQNIYDFQHKQSINSRLYIENSKLLLCRQLDVYINDHRGHGKTAKLVENLGNQAEKDGFKWLVEDVHKLTGIIKKEILTCQYFYLDIAWKKYYEL